MLYVVLPTGSVSDLEKSFFSIHNQFYLMSSKRGKVLAFFFLFEILYLVGIVWYTFLVNESGELQIKKTVSLRDILIQVDI